MDIEKLLSTLSDRDTARTEAMVQADIRQFLLEAPLNLSDADLENIVLESQVGDRRRIDVEVGATVIEVKKDLRKGNIQLDAVTQLEGYIDARQSETGCRYVGVLTDGADWKCYNLSRDGMEEVTSITVDSTKPDTDAFLVWLDGVLATTEGLAPVPRNIRERLGSGSSAHALDRASLARLYLDNANKATVQMKRKLWARLLTTALGTQFEDSDALFIEHTLLVNSAEIIAHAVIGLDVETINPASLLSGAKFDESEVYGVVEADFFDWVVEVPGGERFIHTLARRLSRFEWSDVEHDVLKVFYESIIGADTRKKLGEYYTPDWLAESVVDKVINDPMEQRVLDPACGSGTFLFHAVRKYLASSKKIGKSLNEQLIGVTTHVIGLDIHPVAVALARVTYLLAIGRDNLASPDRGTIQVPVFLGDSMQWQQMQKDLWSSGHLSIQVDDGLDLLSTELKFPDALLENARVFDELVQVMADKASSRTPGTKAPSLKVVFQRLAIQETLQKTITHTFTTMCRLHDEGRDHIWGYYIRNLARPLWLSRLENRVDVLVGNPPWLAYRHMPIEMQKTFREMSKDRGLWHGAAVSTHQDLSGLFVARTTQQYLNIGGKFGFVMPNAVVDRTQFDGFRQGEYPDNNEPTNLAFNKSWDLRRIRPHFFPRGCAVVFGKRTKKPTKMPADVQIWSGKKIPPDGVTWASLKTKITRQESSVHIASSETNSEYRARFTQGAILAPRVLFVVKEKPSGPLGVPSGKAPIVSHRGVNEKPPWKQLDSLEGVLEKEFIRPLYLGENVLPYLTLTPFKSIIPWDGKKHIGAGDEELDLYKGLSDWWKRAEEIWIKNRRSDKLSLLEQLDYRGKLSKQFPIQPIRIVYTKSGMHLAAAIVRDNRAVINNSLYWATATCEDEAYYLIAILNAATTTEIVRPLMSYGKDERHFDKHLWQLAIPMFEKGNKQHKKLAELSRIAEKEISKLTFDMTKHFAALRRRVREHISTSETGNKIEKMVRKLLESMQM